MVLSVNVAVPLNPTGGVQVAFKVLALGLNVPPALVLQVPPVAAPPIEPFRAVVVPPWQMVCPVPASTIGVGRTVIVFVSLMAAQGAMPVVVSVSVAVPL